MASARPYIGCRIGLLSKAQNRYEGILYTIDKNNSTVVLAKVKCFGTEGRPTDRPTPPKDDVYEYITFCGSDIKDITLCESPRSHHGLPPDPAIIQSSSSSSGIYSTLGQFSPLRMPIHNQLAASTLLNQQYAAALGLGHLHPDLHIRWGPMVEKAVQTIQVERPRQRRGLTDSQDRQWNRRPPRTRGDNSQPQREPGANSRPPVNQGSSGVSSNRQDAKNQNAVDRPPPKRRQAPRRRRSRGRGQLMVVNLPSPILKFDTDFDFDSSNAQFIKEELERELQERRNLKDENDIEKAKEGMCSTENCEDFGPKWYYNKAKSFFDNVSSDNGLSFRLTWAEERKRNLETFGVTGRFLRGQGFRGRFSGQRGRGAAQTFPSDRIQRGRL
ncbi:protein LSM14 homolog B isoform X1 [Fundulus heteroclitus]|uniref:protein LSM14 homolog B isoform X1 n=1 Tax=Fundulus heteroclitus TaxID=8078 RepID=UPI00165B3BCB|nr:protein LSM14 homolog B isoform X1 [Fundulus heteroclitus]